MGPAVQALGAAADSNTAADRAAPATVGGEDVLLILPVPNLVLFPGVVLPVTIGGRRSLAAAQEAVRTQRRVGLLLQTDPAAPNPTGEELHRVGTVATIVRFVTAPDGTHHVICQGEERFSVLDYVSHDPFLVARIERRKEPTVLDRDIEARGLNLREKALTAVQLLPQAPAELSNALRAIGSIPALADFVVSFMDISVADKQQILASFDLKARLDRVLELLNERIAVLKVSRDIDARTQGAFDERQKEAVLRERLRQIQKELGETDQSKDELADLKTAIDAAGMPPDVAEQARRELGRLERMPDAAAEYSMIRTRPCGSRRRPPRARQGQAPHPGVPRGAQAESRRPQPDPLLRRAARRRQDLAGSEHCPRDRPEIRPRESGRRA
jgi:ATP-dependent Lon protease